MTFTKCAIGFSIFALFYGFAACETSSFLSGYFAGAAAVATFHVWEDELYDDE